MIDVDREAHKHGVPPSTVKGEAERTAAEDPSEQIHENLERAKTALDAEKERAETVRTDETDGDPEAPPSGENSGTRRSREGDQHGR
jgi:hypothetical protein